MCTEPKLHTEKINKRYAVNCIQKMTRPSNFARGNVQIVAIFPSVWKIFLEVHTLYYHGVYRQTGFLSSRPNWLPPSRHPPESVDNPLCFQEGAVLSQSDEGDRHSGILGIVYCIIPLRILL
jgi:hypothetical protein